MTDGSQKGGRPMIRTIARISGKWLASVNGERRKFESQSDAVAYLMAI